MELGGFPDSRERGLFPRFGLENFDDILVDGGM